MSEQREPLKKKLTITEAKAVKAKVKATLENKSQNVAAQEVFPNQTPEAAAVSMTRTLKKANVQEALEDALARHNLTPDKIVQVVAEGMIATKTASANGLVTGSEYPDHTVRLAAAKTAAQFMGVGNGEGGTTFNIIAVQQRATYKLS